MATSKKSPSKQSPQGHKFFGEGLTFDDVLLVPDYSQVLPREVNISTRLTKNITLNVPLLSAAMDTVTEANLAIALAREGGIGILHKNMSIEKQVEQVRKVKRSESGLIIDPITLLESATIGDEFNAFHERTRQQRRYRRGVNVSARALHQGFDEVSLARDKRAAYASGLAQRAHVNHAWVLDVEVLEHATAVFTEHTKAMCVVEQDPRVVSVGERHEFAHWRNVTVHAEHGIHRNQFAASLRRREQLLKLREIVVCVPLELRA